MERKNLSRKQTYCLQNVYHFCSSHNVFKCKWSGTFMTFSHILFDTVLKLTAIYSESIVQGQLMTRRFKGIQWKKIHLMNLTHTQTNCDTPNTVMCIICSRLNEWFQKCSVSYKSLNMSFSKRTSLLSSSKLYGILDSNGWWLADWPAMAIQFPPPYHY